MYRSVIVLFLLVIAGNAYSGQPYLLGSIEDGKYISPDGKLGMVLPFSNQNSKTNSVKDAVYPRSLIVTFEDNEANIGHRVEYGHITEGSIEKTVETRVFQYRTLISRAYPGEVLLVHLDDSNNIYRYLYKQVTGEQVHFHHIQMKPYKNRMILVWSDFIQTGNTPENEDKVINGKHPGMTYSRKLFESIGR